MRLISTSHLKPETTLGKSIYNERNQVLLHEGVVLSERMISRLIEMGVPYVYIKDPKTEHIIPKSSLDEKIRRESIKAIEDTFEQIDNGVTISDSSFVIEQASKKFMQLIRSIMFELKDNKELLTILSDVFIHDHYIFTHSFNVTLYSLAIGMELKLNQKQLEILGMGAILHDVGKMKVSLDVLLKPGKLTDDEYSEMKKHAEYGFQILKEVNTIPLLVAHCAYQHHERINGSGYPRGLKEADIHYYGKIIAVADVFDAVTSNRVYRKAMLPHEGLEILYAGSGSMFDRGIVEAFRKSVAVYPVGLTVILNDKRVGIVSKQNTGISDRPIIQILEEDGKRIENPYEVNLVECLDIVIIDCDTTLQSGI